MENDVINLQFDKILMKFDPIEEVFGALTLVQKATDLSIKNITVDRLHKLLMLLEYEIENEEQKIVKTKCTHMIFEKNRATSLRTMLAILFTEFSKNHPEERMIKDIPFSILLDVRNILKRSIINEKMRLNIEKRDKELENNNNVVDVPEMQDENTLIEQEYLKILDTMYNNNIITGKYKKDPMVKKAIMEFITNIANYYIHYGNLIKNSFVYYDKESMDNDIRKSLVKNRISNLDTVRILEEIDAVFNIPKN